MTVERAGNDTWLLQYEGRTVLWVELQEVSTLDELHYVKMEPAVDLTSLPRSVWREAKRIFEREARFPMYALCQGEGPARFLRFFGFAELRPYFDCRMFWRP